MTDRGMSSLLQQGFLGEPDDVCAHGCGGYATIEHADGRMLCRPCYDAETGNAERLGCPTCGGASAS